MEILALIMFFVSMILLVLVSVKPEWTRSKLRKQVALIFVPLCLIVFLIAVFSVIDDWLRKNETITAEASASAVKHSDELAGLGVSRADAIKRLKERGYTFERGVDLSGEESFVAKVGPTVVRLSGPEANLNSVEIILGPMDPKNDATFHQAATILATFDLVFPSWSSSDIVDWLTEATTNFQGQHNEDGKKVLYSADITTTIETFTISSIR